MKGLSFVVLLAGCTSRSAQPLASSANDATLEWRFGVVESGAQGFAAVAEHASEDAEVQCTPYWSAAAGVGNVVQIGVRWDGDLPGEASLSDALNATYDPYWALWTASDGTVWSATGGSAIIDTDSETGTLTVQFDGFEACKMDGWENPRRDEAVACLSDQDGELTATFEDAVVFQTQVVATGSDENGMCLVTSGNAD